MNPLVSDFERVMQTQRHSTGLIWICIGVLGLVTLVSQLKSFKPEPAVSMEFESLLTVAGISATVSEQPVLAGPVEPERAVFVVEDGSNPSQPPEANPVDLFVNAIIEIESGGNPHLVGSAGERGLMQIMRTTWADITEKAFGSSIQFDRAFEPDLNVEMGKAYLKYLQAFLHDYQAQWKSDRRSLLLACYNAGPGAVLEAQFDTRLLPQSTQSYVERAVSLHDFYLVNRAQDTTAGLVIDRERVNVL